MKKLVAIVVLYKQSPSESVALQTLLAGLQKRKSLLRLIIYDNSPASQAELLQLDIARDISTSYFHNGHNGGLVAAYTYALGSAALEGDHWLMLLDQDTEVTTGYLDEAFRLCSGLLTGCCALTPRLIVHGQQRSPHADGTRRSGHASSAQASIPTGRSESRLAAWNSGAILSVARLVAIGGFPMEFPLDNLDYALFHLLQQGDERVFVMDSELRHQLSVADLHSLSASRLHSKLRADILLQRRLRHRTRLSLAVELFRTGLSLLRKLPDKRMGLTCLRYSLASLVSTR